MKYIEIKELSNGGHRNFQKDGNLFLEGWAVIPDKISTPNFPFGKIETEIIEGKQTVVSWTPYPIPLNNIEILDESKEQKIKQSKIDLSNYLETHPIQWTDGEYYSITAEKQQQLTSKIMVATMAQTLSQPYDLTWNSTGEVCKEWTLSDLSALAFAIDQRVTALVSYQQTQEVAMRNATTQEELNSIIVDYDSVRVTNEKTK